MLEIRAIQRRYRREPVLAGIDLDVARGEIVAIIGPSGAGKSTLLRIIAGLDRQDAGTLHFEGRDLTPLRPDRRRIGMTFDDGALYDHLSVRANVAIAQERRTPAGGSGENTKSAPAHRASGQQALFGIEPLLDRKPPTLSAGQRRRVALERALASAPDILLLDEPLTHLDVRARRDLAEDLSRAVEDLRPSTLLVTHDHADAIAIAHRLAYLDGGKILHVGSAASFARPAHVAVARGCSWRPMNVLDDPVSGGSIAFPSEALHWGQSTTASGPVDRVQIQGTVVHAVGENGPLRRTDLASQGVVVTVAVHALGPAKAEGSLAGLAIGLGRLRCQLPGDLPASIGQPLRGWVAADQLQHFDRLGRAMPDSRRSA
jgi:ABC-type sugar transport system ATPase subunit